MAKVCAKCNRTFIDKRILTCSTCKKSFHIDCTNVSDKMFYLMKGKKSSKWDCKKCLNIKRADVSTPSTSSALTTKNLYTPCNNVTERQRVKVNVCTENSFESLNSEDSDDEECSTVLNRSCQDTA